MVLLGSILSFSLGPDAGVPDHRRSLNNYTVNMLWNLSTFTGLQAALQPPALSSRLRIDLVVAGSAYSASIDANAKLLYRICHCCHSNLAPGPLQAKRVASEAEHELWIRCVLALFCRLGA